MLTSNLLTASWASALIPLLFSTSARFFKSFSQCTSDRFRAFDAGVGVSAGTVATWTPPSVFCTSGQAAAETVSEELRTGLIQPDDGALFYISVAGLPRSAQLSPTQQQRRYTHAAPKNRRHQRKETPSNCLCWSFWTTSDLFNELNLV